MWSGQTEHPKIVSVGALDGDSFSITLESGHTILLELSGRVHELAFAALIQNGMFCKPLTDGERIYWPGGPSITVDEIIAMLLSNGSETQT